LSEWLDFMLSVFGYDSFRLVSKSNRNAYNTTRYWMDKMFSGIAQVPARGCAFRENRA
jgi:hypothetical protein